jgi:uncharacterized damage-inducible protein DinB
MSSLLSSIATEYRRYKALGEGAIAQVDDAHLSRAEGDGSNSIAVIVWHIAGNLQSRFTDFLTADGEKPWRHRDEEFEGRTVTRQQLLDRWEEGWRVLFAALGGLSDADLHAMVTIRGQAVTVHDALHRSLAHTSYHVGQIVYLAKSFVGEPAWHSLSIPRGQSEAANRRMREPRPEDVR